MRRKLENANELIKTVLLLFIASVDNRFILDYVGICLHDGFTTYRYPDLIKIAHKALDYWEMKLNSTNKAIDKKYLNKAEAMFYLGLNKHDKFKWLQKHYKLKVEKDEKGGNLYSLAELNRVKAESPSMRKAP